MNRLEWVLLCIGVAMLAVGVGLWIGWDLRKSRVATLETESYLRGKRDGREEGRIEGERLGRLLGRSDASLESTGRHRIPLPEAAAEGEAELVDVIPPGQAG